MAPGPGGRGGARGRLNDETQRRIIEALTGCPHFDPAARYAGISPSTLYDWLARGRRYQAFLDTGGDGDALAERLWRKGAALWNNGDHQAAFAVIARLDAHTDRSEELPYLRLLEAVEEVRARVEVELGAVVRRAAREGDWKAALAMLKASFPSRWSDRRELDDHRVAPDEESIVDRKQDEARALLDRAKERRLGSA